jgi:hypothetical protein
MTYIVSRRYDWAFFLLPPIASLCLGIAVSGTSLARDVRWLGLERDTLVGFCIGTVIHAHLVAVVFRSHANPAIRRRHPLRFLVVPVALWLAIVASPWLAVASTVVATFWDVWHSGAQTFGFARIYERNHGNPPELGRRWDLALNQVLYAGPMLAGATLMEHVRAFDSFADVGDALFASVPAHVEGLRRWLVLGVIAAGSLVVIGYLIAYWRIARRGWKPPWLKVWLVASTGLVSIYTWGFNSWGQAFLIMNLFHGVQYLALVWAKEGKRIAGLFRLPSRLGLAADHASGVAEGVRVQVISSDLTALWAATIVVSLMHFWYDAFVWSVRRAEV